MYADADDNHSAGAAQHFPVFRLGKPSLLGDKGNRQQGGLDHHYLRLFVLQAVSGGPSHSEFSFLQFHMHWGDTIEKGSEHLINGKPYAAEVISNFSYFNQLVLLEFLFYLK